MIEVSSTQAPALQAPPVTPQLAAGPLSPTSPTSPTAATTRTKKTTSTRPVRHTTQLTHATVAAVTALDTAKRTNKATPPRASVVAQLIEAPKPAPAPPTGSADLTTMLEPIVTTTTLTTPPPQSPEQTSGSTTPDAPTASQSFADLLDIPWGTHLVEFDPSYEVAERIYARGDGVYLLTFGPNFANHPVCTVAWANSDHWAARIWSIPQYRGPLLRPDVESLPPDLSVIGRPGDATFKKLLEFELAKTGAPSASELTHRQYRIWDSEFSHTVLRGSGGVRYYFSSKHPASDRRPVAVSYCLPILDR